MSQFPFTIIRTITFCPNYKVEIIPVLWLAKLYSSDLKELLHPFLRDLDEKKKYSFLFLLVKCG